jgi:hypothetical protein
MRSNETELEMAERHVREGSRHLKDQQDLIDWLYSRGYPTDLAETLMTLMEEVQQLHCDHVARLCGRSAAQADVR